MTSMRGIVRLPLAVLVAVALSVPLTAVAAASPRSGALHVTKDCSAYTGDAGSFCTITSSNVESIKVGSRIIYDSALAYPILDTTIEIDGPGNNDAAGSVLLDFSSLPGVVTIDGGSGVFRHFHASAVVSFSGGVWHWDGTYSYSPPS